MAGWNPGDGHQLRSLSPHAPQACLPALTLPQQCRRAIRASPSPPGLEFAAAPACVRAAIWHEELPMRKVTATHRAMVRTPATECAVLWMPFRSMLPTRARASPPGQWPARPYSDGWTVMSWRLRPAALVFDSADQITHGETESHRADHPQQQRQQQCAWIVF